MAEARAKLRKEAEEERTFIKGLGFCSFGIGSNPAAVDVKSGKISRIRPLRYDWKYQPEAFNPWKIEAKVLIEQWRKEYNQVRPHSSLHYRIQPVLVEKRGIRVWKWKKRLMKRS